MMRKEYHTRTNRLGSAFLIGMRTIDRIFLDLGEEVPDGYMAKHSLLLTNARKVFVVTVQKVMSTSYLKGTSCLNGTGTGISFFVKRPRKSAAHLYRLLSTQPPAS